MPAPSRNPLEEIFQRELPRLLAQHRGKYVLITPDGAPAVWTTAADALQAATRFLPPRTGFLVRPIETQEEADAPMAYVKLWNAYYDAGGKVEPAALARLREAWGKLSATIQAALPAPPGRDLGGSDN